MRYGFDEDFWKESPVWAGVVVILDPYGPNIYSYILPIGCRCSWAFPFFVAILFRPKSWPRTSDLGEKEGWIYNEECVCV